jgi:IclR family transcriptional regulator, acetate operon repressor
MPNDDRRGPVQRTLAILEVVAERGGASAKDIAEALDLPLATVYRLAADLVGEDYLVHIRDKRRYELGYKLHRLGLSLHHQIGLSRGVRDQVVRLHEDTGLAAYLTIHRGAELVVVLVVDSPRCPRLRPIRFGFHEAPHATAFGKLLLSELDDEQRRVHVGRHGMRAMTPHTITDYDELCAHLRAVALEGIAWEFEEFLEGSACASAPVRGDGSLLLGSVAVSAPAHRLRAPDERLADQLRQAASRLSQHFRTGATVA